MDNHLHLAVERGPTNLSRVMLALQSAYTQWFNRRHGRVGHLFQGRYKAFLIEKDRYLVALVRYIHRNPLGAGSASGPQDYAWRLEKALQSLNT
jgi:putative transposase